MGREGRPVAEASPRTRRSAVAGRLLYGSLLATALVLCGAAVNAVPALHGKHAPPATPSLLEPLDFRLRNLVLGNDGHVLGSRGGTVYRIVDEGARLQPVATFTEPVNGMHVMADGSMLVATDVGPNDPALPCTIHLLDPATGTARAIKTIAGGTALWWSLASDVGGGIYVGEYGPKQAGVSTRVWKSTDRGRSWAVVFRAPAEPGTHIHRVAVDPYSGDLWVSVGDGARRGIFRSRDGGDRWERVLDSQATGVAFTADAVYWGEDDLRGGRVTRLDRATQRVETALDSSRFGNFGGSIYSMSRAPDGFIYAPTMKYSEQRHRATLWRGQGRSWTLVAELPPNEEGAVNAETIAGPDRDGWIYLTGYRLRAPEHAAP